MHVPSSPNRGRLTTGASRPAPQAGAGAWWGQITGDMELATKPHALLRPRISLDLRSCIPCATNTSFVSLFTSTAERVGWHGAMYLLSGLNGPNTLGSALSPTQIAEPLSGCFLSKPETRKSAQLSEVVP